MLTLAMGRHFVFQKCFDFYLDGFCITEVLGPKKSDGKAFET